MSAGDHLIGVMRFECKYSTVAHRAVDTSHAAAADCGSTRQERGERMSADSTDSPEALQEATALVREEVLGGLPHDALAKHGIGSEVAYDLLSNELLLDGSARLNLATFVTTWMPERAAALMANTADKNMIDKDEYPQTAEIERRCVNIIGRLWHASGAGDVTGTSTVGSSEAAMLGGMALKWRWRERMKAAGKPTDRPNLVTGINVQVCWEKFCRYWDVEPRLLPMEGDRFHLDAEGAVSLCDENTIGVVAVLGSTFDGSYEPVGEICAALDDLAASGGPDVPVHVDAASGGFIAPFVQPELVWDFQLDRVHSINASGHKYGLVYPGVGWAIWRDRERLPRDLVFEVNYLGGSMPTFALNFSRPGSEVVAQYFMFVALGAGGYREIQRASSRVAQHIAHEIAEIGPYKLITDGSDLPVFAFTTAPEVSNYTVFDVSAQLRESGWLVPAYTFPDNRQDLSVLRVVVRAGMTMDMADLFLDAVHKRTAFLESLTSPLPEHDEDKRAAFKH
jgi:glutamate decarboxylase